MGPSPPVEQPGKKRAYSWPRAGATMSDDGRRNNYRSRERGTPWPEIGPLDE